MRVFIICLIFIVVSCSADSTETMFVSGRLADCQGVAPQKCLQIKFDQNDDWTYFYNNIDGFAHKEGTDFKLKVKREDIKNPPADAASFKYILIEILEEQPTPIDLEDGSWLVSGMVNYTGQLQREPVITFSPQQNQVTGNTGCNRFLGKLFKENNNITFQNIGTTKMACDDNGLEQAFLQTLETVASYQVVENILMLIDNQGNTLLKASHIERKE